MASDAEIEAAARTIFATAVGADKWDNDWYREERDGCFHSARAALEAAERVRAQKMERRG